MITGPQERPPAKMSGPLGFRAGIGIALVAVLIVALLAVA